MQCSSSTPATDVRFTPSSSARKYSFARSAIQSVACASAGPPVGATTPVYSAEPVAYRGPESLGGLLLILAGIAAAVSLVLDWVADVDGTGLDLVRDGFEDLDAIVDNGLWQPMAVVLGGGVEAFFGDDEAGANA